MSLARRLARDLLLACLAALPALGAVLLGAPGPLGLTFNLGPNDHPYVQGFAPLYEIAADVGLHWASRQARVSLPLSVSGEATLRLRSARILPEGARTTVTLGPRVAGEFGSRAGRFEVRSFALGPLREAPLEVGLQTASQDPRGLLVDWLQVEVGAGGRLRLRGAALWRPALLAALTFALLRLAGFAGGGALAGALPVSLALALLAWRWPFLLAHASAKLTVPLAVVGLPLAVALRRVARGRWALLVFLLSFLVKGAGVFHPDFFYPDNQVFRRYVLGFVEARGDLAERGLAGQAAANSAYRSVVGGRTYPFPYSPAFALPFLALPRDPLMVEDGLRLMGLTAAALEVLLVFLVARLACGGAAGVGAAVVAGLLPLTHSRLLLSMWPTLVGHVFDVLAIAALALALRPPGGLLPWLRAGLALWTALLLYVSSLFGLGAFTLSLAALRRRSALPLLMAYAAGASLAVLLLYHPFLRAFLGEILPQILAGARIHSDAEPARLVGTLARLPRMFGWGPLALAVGGLALVHRQAEPALRAALGAWGLAFLLLTSLRLSGSGLFRDLKELTFVAPLVAVLAGATLEDLWGRGRGGRAAALMLAVGLAAVCGERYASSWHDACAVAMRTVGLP